MNMGVNNSTLGILIGLLKRKVSSIQQETIEWLDENISNPDSPPLDRTLTSSSSAAPADLVGNNLDLKADKTDTILYTTLSRGRKENTTVGDNSFAFGNNVTASGMNSHAEGSSTSATGSGSHAEGGTTTASASYAHSEGSSTFATGSSSHAEGSGSQAVGSAAHAEGSSTKAYGTSSHSEGQNTISNSSCTHAEGSYAEANGSVSHAEGSHTIANGAYSHVCGKYNVADSYDDWPEWVAGTSYSVGDRVKRTTTSSGNTFVQGYICKTANSDSSFSSSKWTSQSGAMNYVEIVGNGISSSRSNARALDWSGNEYLNGDLYIGCNADGTGGTKVGDLLVSLQSQINELRALIPQS